MQDCTYKITEIYLFDLGGFHIDTQLGMYSKNPELLSRYSPKCSDTPLWTRKRPPFDLR